MTECIFCKIIKGEIPCEKVYENDKIFAFLDIKPVNKGHTLVVPKEHFTDLFEMTDDVLSDVFVKVKKIAKTVMDAVKADGINIGMNNKPAAGQIVFHAHLHIIPRFTGDGLKHWPSKDATKEELLKTREEIVKYLR